MVKRENISKGSVFADIFPNSVETGEHREILEGNKSPPLERLSVLKIELEKAMKIYHTRDNEVIF